MTLAPGRTHAGVEETRARILAATREIFERNGTRGTTTREVAERAGVNEATLFRHFGSKAALIGAMRTEACGLEAFRNLVTALDGRDIAADLKALARYGVSQMLEQRKLMCIAIAEDAVEEPGEAEFTAAPEWRAPHEMLDRMTEYFAGRVAEGRVAGEPRVLARLLMGMLFQFVVARKLWVGQAIDRGMVDFTIDVFLNGVKV